MEHTVIPTAHPYRHAILATIAGLFAVVLGSLLLGFSYERLYAGRIYPGVVVLGVRMDGKSYAEARAIINDRAQNVLAQPITLKYPNATTTTITPADLGLDLIPDTLTQQAFERGRTGRTLDRWSEIILLRSSGAALAFSPTYQPDGLLASLEDSFAPHEHGIQNAELKAVDGKLTITESQSGVRIARDELTAEFEEMFKTLEFPTQVTIPTETVAAQVTEADLESIRLSAEAMTSQPMTLVVGDKTFTVTSATLVGWLTSDTSAAMPQLAWNKDLVAGYLQTTAQKVDVAMVPRKYNAKTYIMFQEGTPGKKLNHTQAQTAIIDALTSRQQGNLTAQPAPLLMSGVTVEEKIIQPSFTPGIYAGKYIEVNLKEQMLYQFEGSNLLASYKVSTGKWDTPTPEGTLYIKNHISYAYSRPHDLYMPWWLGLAWNQDGSGYEGYGIHELPEWRGGRKEGQSHLGTPVSHGCIRLGIGPAEAIYAWAEEGMPVYIHK